MNAISIAQPMLSSLHALLVARGAATRQRCLERLEAAGHRALVAESAEEAMALLDAVRPDVVIVDDFFLRGDPQRLASRLKGGRTAGRLPLIAIVETDVALEAAVSAAIGDWYLVEPLNPSLIDACLRTVARFAGLADQLASTRTELERYSFRAEDEIALAREVIARIVRTDPRIAPIVHTLMTPAAVFSGDIVLAEATPDGRLHLMLADAAGHGLAAALMALPLAHVFRTMTRKGYGLRSIVQELNQEIRDFLPPHRFVAAALVSVCPSDGVVEVWNGGIPTVLMLDEAGRVIERWHSSHLPLGVVGQETFDPEPFALPFGRGAQIVVLSDGLIEAAAPDGRRFGEARLIAALANAAPAARKSALIESLEQHLAGTDAEDDVSFAIVDCDRVEGAAATVAEPDAEPETSGGAHLAGTWQVSLTLGPRELQRLDVVPLIQGLVGAIDPDALGSPRLFLVLSELFNNALDHGLLRLDSGLKEGPDGMGIYLDERARRLSRLETGAVRFDVARVERADGALLNVGVRDSGGGFDHERATLQEGISLTLPHGRGIRLLRSLCETVQYRGAGNEVEVRFAP